MNAPSRYKCDILSSPSGHNFRYIYTGLTYFPWHEQHAEVFLWKRIILLQNKAYWTPNGPEGGNDSGSDYSHHQRVSRARDSTFFLSHLHAAETWRVRRRKSPGTDVAAERCHQPGPEPPGRLAVQGSRRYSQWWILSLSSRSGEYISFTRDTLSITS